MTHDFQTMERIYEERLKVLPVTYRMEQRGVTLSGDRLRELRSQYREESGELGERCLAVAAEYDYDLKLPRGSSLNDSMRSFFWDVLKLPVKLNPKTKRPALDKNVMQEYLLTVKRGTMAWVFLTAWQAKKKRDTSVSYMDAYERFAVKRDDGVWVLHPNLNPTGTDTLRFSSKNPNSQNISKQESECERCDGEGCGECHDTGMALRSLKYVFGPAEGREWYSFDARGIEDRLPAYRSGQQELIDIFERPDEPPYFGSNHYLRLHTVYPDVWERHPEVWTDQEFIKKRYKATEYQWCKNGGFAVQYGAIDRADGGGTADRAFHKRGAHKLLKERFSKLEALNQECIRHATKTGYVYTFEDRSIGAKHGYPLFCTRTSYGRVLETVPLNYVIQGCLQGHVRVHTDQGMIPIKELAGKKINVWTGFKWAQATGLNRGTAQTAKITLSSGLVIDCDVRHKLKNERDEWVEFKDLKAGDYVALHQETQRVEPSQEMTWAFLFGFIIGDGCLSNNKGREGLGIAGGLKKRPIIEQIYEFLLAEGYTGNKLKYKDRGGVIFRTIPPSGVKAEKYFVSIENKDFAAFLKSKGFSFSWKSKTKRIPESVWRSSLQERRDFLEGLWMSDGSRAKASGSGHGLNMVNPKLLHEVQVLSSSLGYDSQFYGTRLHFRWKAFNAKSTRLYPAESLVSKIKTLDRAEYHGSSEYITDKRNLSIAQNGKGVTQYVAERMLKKSAPDAPIYRYDTITSIEVSQLRQTTYTMSVNDPLHQFVADGVIHANSAMWWTMKAMIRVDAFFERLNRGERFAGRVWRGGYYLCLQVHDEIVCDMPKGKTVDYNAPIADEVRRLMAMGGEDYGIPTPTGCEYHTENWAQGV